METKPPEKKGILKKIKENVDDHDEQMQILGAMVRLGVVIWSGFIITLNYVELPMVKKTGDRPISRSSPRFLRVHWLRSGYLQVEQKVRKTNNNQNNEETNSSLSPVITRSSKS